jgi:hypothetical protein
VLTLDAVAGFASSPSRWGRHHAAAQAAGCLAPSRSRSCRTQDLAVWRVGGFDEYRRLLGLLAGLGSTRAPAEDKRVAQGGEDAGMR